MNTKNQVILFLVFAILGILTHWFLFEIKFRWYVSKEDALLLDVICYGGIFLMCLIWYFYPSKILIGTLSIVIFLLPQLIRSEAFLGVKLDMIPILIIPVVLLLLATEFRRRMML